MSSTQLCERMSPAMTFQRMTENRLEIPDESSLQVSSTIRKIKVSLMETKPQAYPARDAAVVTARSALRPAAHGAGRQGQRRRPPSR